jgi:hypothetical protein
MVSIMRPLHDEAGRLERQHIDRIAGVAVCQRVSCPALLVKFPRRRPPQRGALRAAFHHRHSHDRGGAAARTIIETQRAALQLDQPSGDRQSEPGASRPRRDERLEQVLAHVARNALQMKFQVEPRRIVTTSCVQAVSCDPSHPRYSSAPARRCS